jgi:ubiquitin-conjugating enzyme E2 M
MIRIFGPQATKRAEEEKEENKEPGVRRKTPGELRLQRELSELTDLPSYIVMDFPDENNLMTFNVALQVIERSSLWFGATYHFTFTVPAGYPHDPPKVKCNTRLYHPNIDLDGNVCLNILRGDWKPVLCINAVILGLSFLFTEPNPNDPLNTQAAETMRDNLGRFEENVRRSLRGGAVDGVTYPRLIS